MAHISVIGGGIIGRSWAVVFARAGVSVRILSRRKGARPEILHEIQGAAQRAQAIRPDVSVESILARVTIHEDLVEAVTDSGFVMEAVEEDLAVKATLFRDLDHHAPPDAVMASSTSSFGISRFAALSRIRPRRRI